MRRGCLSASLAASAGGTHRAGDLLFVDRGGDQTRHLPTPPLALARSWTDAQPIHNKESNDPKRDQAVGHNMQHASSLRSLSRACHENERTEDELLCPVSSMSIFVAGACTIAGRHEQKRVNRHRRYLAHPSVHAVCGIRSRQHGAWRPHCADAAPASGIVGSADTPGRPLRLTHGC